MVFFPLLFLSHEMYLKTLFRIVWLIEIPHLIFDGPELTKEQKRTLVEKFTDAATEVTEIPKEAFVVTIKENKLDNIGVGGKLLSERSH